MMKFRLARQEEFEIIRDLYWDLIEKTAHLPSFPHWKKGQHPSNEWLISSIEKSQMFVLEENEEIVASVILNHEANESYKLVKWTKEVPNKKVLIVHVLAVSPKHSGKGLGTKMMAYIMDYAKETKMQAIRLDVISNNNAAEHLYKKMGFQFVQTQRLYYEVTGEKEFKLYEYYL